jgi:hypothetical protein
VAIGFPGKVFRWGGSIPLAALGGSFFTGSYMANDKGVSVPNDILNRGNTRPPRQGAMGSLPRVLDIPLPWLAPMPASQDIVVMGNLSGQTGVLPRTEIPLAAFALQRGVIGVIRSVTFYVTDMLTTTDITFGLWVNNGPAPGFGAVKMFPRVASSVSNTFDCLLELPPAATIQAFFSIADGGTYNVGCSYTGWCHTEAAQINWLTRGPDVAGVAPYIP